MNEIIHFTSLSAGLAFTSKLFFKTQIFPIYFFYFPPFGKFYSAEKRRWNPFFSKSRLKNISDNSFRDVLKLGSEQNYRTAINWRLKAHDDRELQKLNTSVELSVFKSNYEKKK